MKRLTVRDGMGYRLDVPKDGVSFRVDRIRESGGEVTGEVTISRAPDGHLHTSRANLLSTPARTTLAKYLGQRSNHFDWTAWLERFFMEAIELEREGEEWTEVGRMPARTSPPYQLRPFLYTGKPTILYGRGGLGKSTIAGAIAVAQQTGRCAIPGWEVIRQGPVMILDWEGEREDWNDVIAKVCAGMGMEPPAITYRTCRGPLEAQIHAITERVQRTGTVLVIVDSAEAAMRSPREAGSDDPAKRFYDALRLIPCAALVIDHVTKAQAEHGGNGGPIGNVTKFNRARMTWELVGSGKPDEDGTHHLGLLNRKNQHDREHEDMGVAMHHVDGTIKLWAETYRQAPGRKKPSGEALWEQLRDLLSGREPMTITEMVAATGLSGKDPIRRLEVAMQRHTDVFATRGKGRLDRLWYVIDGATDDPAAGQIIAFPGASVVPPVGHDDRREHVPGTSGYEPEQSDFVEAHNPEHVPNMFAGPSITGAGGDIGGDEGVSPGYRNTLSPSREGESVPTPVLLGGVQGRDAAADEWADLV